MNNQLKIAFICVFAVLIPLFIFWGYSTDARLAFEYFGFTEGSYSVNFIPLIILLSAYIIRGAILVAPLLYLGKKWHKITSYGLIALVLPEAYILYWVFGLLVNDTCEELGIFSDCGWAPLLIYAILLSSFIQLLGMSAGALKVKLAK